MSIRLILGFLIAPLATPAIFLGFKALTDGFYSTRGLTGVLEDVLSGFALIAIFAYVAAFALGIPLFFVYRRFHVSSVLAYCAGGIVIALLAMTLISLITRGPNFMGNEAPSVGLVKSLLVLAVCGASSALLFRLILFRGASGR